MKSRVGTTLAGITITLLSASLVAQSPTTDEGDGHHVVHFDEVLQARGIPLTHASLAAALYNNDPRIRLEAASVLAENHDPDAASLIKGALATESDLKTTIEFAGILVSLGDAAGENRLTKICADESLPAETVSYAVFQLVLRQSGAQCIDVLIRRAQNPTSRNNTTSLIEALTRLYRSASPAQKNEISTVFQNGLSDKKPTTRVVASRGLAQTASPNSAEIIKIALQREVDPIVRAGMESDLTTLTAKH
ncbi:MAG TPA: hypothetical protein VK684_06270 [Edaphobacter sp.]|jgi:hypothetical protein|nr:hypothetical protein [Edaphobacter sp.]